MAGKQVNDFEEKTLLDDTDLFLVQPQNELTRKIKYADLLSQISEETLKTVDIEEKQYTNQYEVIKKLIEKGGAKIGCIGDSLTYGDNPGEETTGKPYPEILSTFLNKYYECTVYNFGVNGALSAIGITNFNKLVENECDIAIWCFGTNDITFGNTYEKIAEYLIIFIEKCNQANITPVIVTPPPMYVPDIQRIDKQDFLAEVIKQVCRAMNVLCSDTYSDIQNLMNNLTITIGDRSDGVHFFDYREMAGSILKNIFCFACPVMGKPLSYALAFRGQGIRTNGAQNDSPETPFYRNVALKAGNTYTATFYTESVCDFYMVCNGRASTATGVFDIDGVEKAFDGYYSSNDNVNRLIRYGKLKPGIHTITLKNVLKGQSAGVENPSFYLSGFAFLPYENDLPVLGVKQNKEVLFESENGLQDGDTGKLKESMWKYKFLVIKLLDSNVFITVPCVYNATAHGLFGGNNFVAGDAAVSTYSANITMSENGMDFTVQYVRRMVSNTSGNTFSASGDYKIHKIYGMN